MKWDILGLSEVQQTGENQSKLKSKNTFFYLGEENAIKGTGLLVKKKLEEHIIETKKH